MLLFLLVLVFSITSLNTRVSPTFRPEQSVTSVLAVSVSTMPSLRQFTISFVNGGRREHTHRRLTDIEGVLTKFNPHALFVAESLLDDRTKNRLIYGGFNIEQLHFKTREKRIWAVVRNDTPYKRRSDLERRNCAAIWLQFGTGRNAFLVCGYYREFRIIGDPDYRADVARQRIRFNKYLDVVRDTILSEKMECHLIGDFNLNTLMWKQNGSKTTNWYLQSLVNDLHEKVIQGSGFVQTVSEITRWSKRINSVLDLHFTNRPDRTGSVTISRDFRSDHAVLTLQRKQFDFPGPTEIYKRCWKQVDWLWVYTELKRWRTTLDSFLHIPGVDEHVEKLTALLNFVLDMRWPVKKIKTTKNYSPYVTEQLKKEIKEKDKWYNWAKLTKNPADEEYARKLSNKLGNKIDWHYKMYYELRMKRNMRPEEMWEFAKKYVGWSSPGAPNSIIHEGKRLTDSKEIADAVNEALIEKIRVHTASIPKTNVDPLEFTRKHLQGKIIPEVDLLEPVSIEEINEVIKGLKNTDAAGPDNLTTRTIKKLRPILKPQLHSITNKSFCQKTHARSWKVSKCSPLLKDPEDKDSRFRPLGYRPVGILCSMSKVVEKVIQKRLYSHLERNRLIADTQNGYRRHRGVTTAMVQLAEDILKKQQNGVDSATIFCDCSAAFDTIDHEMLMEKLRLYGVKSDNIPWFKSYLQGRSQYVSIGGVSSKLLPVLWGVVQGSILGPIIFLLIINDIVIIGDRNGTVVIYIYADDTCVRLSLSGNKAADQAKIDSVMKLIQSYMDSHKLRFNFKKTEFVVVAPKTHDKHKDLVLKMNGQVVTQKKSARLLGLYITFNMDHTHYIEEMKNNLLSFLSKRLAVLSIMSERACIKNRKQLAFGLIYSKVIFGIHFWANCTENQQKQLQLLLNQTARLVMGLNTRDMHVKDLFRCLRWHTLASLINYHDYLLYFSINWNAQPANLWTLYDENRAHLDNNAQWTYPNSEGDPLKAMLNEGVVTRQRTMGFIRRNNATDSTHELRFSSFVPRSVRLYNRTPPELKRMDEEESYAEFKKRLRLHCMELELGSHLDWPNYDEMNGRVLPTTRTLMARGEHIVKRRNGLFIEPIPDEDEH